jgi:glycosyltransferase involved in cell wall biosynthesis
MSEPLAGAGPDLVLFTAAFPYDNAESVLGEELEVIAGRFDRILIVPSRIGATARSLPPNVTVVDLGWAAGWPRTGKIHALRARAALAVLSATARSPDNWRSYARGARTYSDILATSILKANSLVRLIEGHGLTNAIFYDYWFENSTLALAILRYRQVIQCAVSRAHRFDVFDSSWEPLGRVPFREFKLIHLDAVFPVSADAEGYLRGRIDGHRRAASLAGKLRVARLGVQIPNFSPPRPTDSCPLVVSCSALLPRKQVHLIPPVLQACGMPLRWVHFGDGPERMRVEAAAASLAPEIRWELRGSVDNATVRDFYATNPVSALLSLSASEGVPVSMMEALGFGVPVVSLRVGGIPELVGEESGVLLAPEARADQVAAALRETLVPSRFDPGRIRQVLARRFDPVTNYTAFADELNRLWETRQAFRDRVVGLT